MSGDKLRDAIAGALYVRDRFDSPTVVLADAILALPEMQALLNKDDEITRLRAAGDALAEYLMMSWRSDAASDLVTAWKEARHGQ